MGNVVISIEEVSKQYRLGVIGHGTLAHDMQSWWARLLGKEDPNSKIVPHSHVMDKKTNEEFWALKGVSFEVNQGDILGIIGRNGAGKSTLLKILSQVTSPTTGSIKIKGRIASLLEVGTGFHPELTGRENIFLNGAILGMTRKEINSKFEEIVDFAEIEKFIDTPVKRYSSGMYVRLAFAVAAHLEPEILIIDEVLAVGDAQFQKKCLGKMGEVSKKGRTVLFVSHQLSAIKNLCTRGLLIEKGKIKTMSNNVSAIIEEYMFNDSSLTQDNEWINQSGESYDNPYFKPLRMFFSDSNGQKLNMPVSNDSEIWVQIEGYISRCDPALVIGYALYYNDGTFLFFSLHTDESEEKWPELNKGYCTLRSKIPSRFLNEGTFKLELVGSLYRREFIFQYGSSPTIYLTITGGLSDSPYWTERRAGLVAPVFKWELVK